MYTFARDQLHRLPTQVIELFQEYRDEQGFEEEETVAHIALAAPGH